jgi:hypothetical protein
MTHAPARCARFEGVPPSDIDAIPIGGGNTIGALLYHVAALELKWLYRDILGTSSPGWSHVLFPQDVREENGRLTSV